MNAGNVEDKGLRFLARIIARQIIAKHLHLSEYKREGDVPPVADFITGPEDVLSCELSPC